MRKIICFFIGHKWLSLIKEHMIECVFCARCGEVIYKAPADKEKTT